MKQQKVCYLKQNCLFEAFSKVVRFSIHQESFFHISIVVQQSLTSSLWLRKFKTTLKLSEQLTGSHQNILPQYQQMLKNYAYNIVPRNLGSVFLSFIIKQSSTLPASELGNSRDISHTTAYCKSFQTRRYLLFSPWVRNMV